MMQGLNENYRERTPKFLLCLYFLLIYAAGIIWQERPRNRALTGIVPLASEDSSTIIQAKPGFGSPRNQTGEWTSNTWIPPPGWQYFSQKDLQSFYSGKNILWIGDSTTRRAAMTQYALLAYEQKDLHLEALESPKLIDITKREKPSPYSCDEWGHLGNNTFRPTICRTVETQGEHQPDAIHLAYVGISCHRGIEEFFGSEMDGRTNITSKFDVIILGMGVWEVIRAKHCKTIGEHRKKGDILVDAISKLDEFQEATGKTVLWRTSGYVGAATKGKIDELNGIAMRELDKFHVKRQQTSPGYPSKLSYVNFGGAIEPRSFGARRIAGDINPHYGVEARLALIQMITNQLRDLWYSNS